MLTRLAVENYALIDSLDVEFDSRLNIITGETGAGKSILMGALSLLLGARNDSEAIKDASRNCVIEGEFNIEGLALEEFFAEHDWEYDKHTIIRRMITPSGKSRAFINDSPVPLAELKEVAGYLIDIHSQHQNLILQSAHFRTKAVDTIAACGALVERYAQSYAELGLLRAKLAEARAEAARSNENEDWLRHQVEELQAAALRDGEVEELEQELQTLENADSISDALHYLHSTLDEDTTGVLTSLKEAESRLRHVEEHYAPVRELIERVHSVAVELKDISRGVASDVEHIESDPERLERVGARLDTLYTLCHKHRVEGVAELIALRDDYAEQLNRIVHSDEHIAELASKLSACEASTRELAEELHEARAAVTPDFSCRVEALLRRLGMAEARFEVRLTPTELTPTGADAVEFVFSANAGVEPRAIEKIASGGELSRVMLALKTILARHLSLPTIIFDEIDTGVSGRVANAVGEIISEAAEAMQVIDITHLPQVASKGDLHLLVYKENSATHIRALDSEERIVEIAKMLSGDSVTEAAIVQAKNLLGQS